MAKVLASLSVVLAVLFLSGVPAHAQLSGAIFTTVSNGSEVNFNIYPSKDAVYLDGGPPPGAPQTAAGLPNGTYVFQVTDPSGKTLLSLDIANCRQFTVANGIITGVVNVGGCQHATGVDIDHNAVTVQLMPYADTPNNGGEYKAWATPVANYLDGCSALGVANGLSVVDCGITGGDFHGFIPSHSKTDNFKVKNNQVNREVDTHFIDSNGNLILGECEIWIDTLGVSNLRCSEVNAAIGNQGWAHVEQVENGVHQFVLSSEAGACRATGNFTGGVSQYVGNKLVTSQLFSGGPGSPAVVDIQIKPNFSGTIEIDVYCNN
jgi:hypothetical protein